MRGWLWHLSLNLAVAVLAFYAGEVLRYPLVIFSAGPDGRDVVVDFRNYSFKPTDRVQMIVETREPIYPAAQLERKYWQGDIGLEELILVEAHGNGSILSFDDSALEKSLGSFSQLRLRLFARDRTPSNSILYSELSAMSLSSGWVITVNDIDGFVRSLYWAAFIAFVFFICLLLYLAVTNIKIPGISK